MVVTKAELEAENAELKREMAALKEVLAGKHTSPHEAGWPERERAYRQEAERLQSALLKLQQAHDLQTLALADARANINGLTNQMMRESGEFTRRIAELEQQLAQATTPHDNP